MMSIRQLIPSLGKELDELCARVASLEGLLGIGGVSPQKSSNADGSCRICGITWQLGMKCFAQHMTGKRHKKNLAKLSNIPPPSSSKLPSPSSSLCGVSIQCPPQILNSVSATSRKLHCWKCKSDWPCSYFHFKFF